LAVVVKVPLATSAPPIDARWIPEVLVVDAAASATVAAFTASTLTVSALTLANGATAMAVSDPDAESEDVLTRAESAGTARTPLAVRPAVMARDVELDMSKPPAMATVEVPAKVAEPRMGIARLPTVVIVEAAV
jgi:hypothetical protein